MRLSLPVHRVIVALFIGLTMWGSHAQTDTETGLFSAIDPDAVVPTLPHEKKPTSWPQPDYLAEAIKLTPFKPSERTQALPVRAERIPASAQYIVLPVQTQGYGFGQAVRAVIGAKLDLLLAQQGLMAGRQVDVVDSYGPFARRFDAATIQHVALEFPRQKLIQLFLGHDGEDIAFVDLTVGLGTGSTTAHRVVKMTDDEPSVVQAISQVLPAMLKEAGVRGVGTPAPKASEAFACKDTAWKMNDADMTASGAEQACHAAVLGTLLMNFDGVTPGVSLLMSPAKAAWLARAYVLAAQAADKAPMAKALRDLSWAQLSMNGQPEPIAYVNAPDPVVSRIAQLLTVWPRSERSPAQSQDAAAKQFLDRATVGLPPFTRAAFIQHGLYGNWNRPADLCAIERAFPGGVMRPSCPAPAMAAADAATASVNTEVRQPSRAELLLYQEWRIAAAYKALAYHGLHLGSREGTL